MRPYRESESIILRVAMDLYSTISTNQSARVATFGLEFIETTTAISLRGEFYIARNLAFLNG